MKTVKTKKIGLIIFARMQSKRFPGKVLFNLYNNKSSLKLIFDNLKKNKRKLNIIVATSKNKSDKKIVNFCKTNKIKYFLGNHHNVFKRTLDCIKKFELDYFVRICADRPLFDISVMNKMISLILKNDYDIVTNSNPRTFPKGLTCEVVKADIFYNVKLKNLSENFKEHILNYFYANKNYKIYKFKTKLQKKFILKNLALDKKSDVKKLQNILSYLKRKKKIVNTLNIQRYFSENY